MCETPTGVFVSICPLALTESNACIVPLQHGWKPFIIILFYFIFFCYCHRDSQKFSTRHLGLYGGKNGAGLNRATGFAIDKTHNNIEKRVLYI